MASPADTASQAETGTPTTQTQPETMAAQLPTTPSHPATLPTALSAPTTEPPSLFTPEQLSAPLPTPIYTTPRLIIRPMHPQDAPSTTHACAPPSITKYMTYAFPSPYTLSHAHTWIHLNISTSLPNYFICLPSSPTTVIGGIGVKPGSDIHSHTAELGYWISEECWGRGYAREAVEGIMEWVFGGKCEEQGVGTWKRVCAGVFGGNDASMRVLERCGFAAEGVQRGHVEKNGVIMDLYLYGMDKAMWEEIKQKKEREGKV